jgi:hypothetical protein
MEFDAPVIYASDRESRQAFGGGRRSQSLYRSSPLADIKYRSFTHSAEFIGNSSIRATLRANGFIRSSLSHENRYSSAVVCCFQSPMLERDGLADDHIYQTVTARQRISELPLPPDVDVYFPMAHRSYQDIRMDWEPMSRYFATRIIATRTTPFDHSRTGIPLPGL